MSQQQPADGERITLRLATPQDAGEIAEFYAPYATGTAVNFEYDAPDAAEFARRIEGVQRTFPFITAVRHDPFGGEHIVGYVFATPMGSRPAYTWSADTSIYLNRDYRGHRIGTLLYDALEPILAYQGVVELFSCITVSEHDDLADLTDPAAREATLARVNDPHLPVTSPRFHRAKGYFPVGRELGVGYKLGTWYDKLWMQKHLQARPAEPKPLVKLPDVPESVIDDAFARALERHGHTL
ncbi:GNAT family N-acetyltransferase [Bifidobacterium avesanii]|uniref:GNAT family N-acetyltransferase n=1 Tax=Bifidobacterium avesanii TaxID=1798157 RepID=A0A7K3TIL0_9BIFI|nr:GNAT family N-acetyltransferase [Bifidobacterium avesanii]KAB8290979.1 acyltransferase [Bifidobacterium avesanii]NEG78746.1 GNAT family N-acetyltransferase [Bifidobacterium avesanii]